MNFKKELLRLALKGGVLDRFQAQLYFQRTVPRGRALGNPFRDRRDESRLCRSATPSSYLTQRMQNRSTHGEPRYVSGRRSNGAQVEHIRRDQFFARWNFLLRKCASSVRPIQALLGLTFARAAVGAAGLQQPRFSGRCGSRIVTLEEGDLPSARSPRPAALETSSPFWQEGHEGLAAPYCRPGEAASR